MSVYSGCEKKLILKHENSEIIPQKYNIYYNLQYLDVKTSIYIHTPPFVYNPL